VGLAVLLRLAVCRLLVVLLHRAVFLHRAVLLHQVGFLHRLPAGLEVVDLDHCFDPGCCRPDWVVDPEVVEAALEVSLGRHQERDRRLGEAEDLYLGLVVPVGANAPAPIEQGPENLVRDQDWKSGDLEPDLCLCVASQCDQQMVSLVVLWPADLWIFEAVV